MQIRNFKEKSYKFIEKIFVHYEYCNNFWGWNLNELKDKPNSFELHGKVIIIYTIEHFENHPEIDGIIVSCVED